MKPYLAVTVVAVARLLTQERLMFHRDVCNLFRWYGVHNVWTSYPPLYHYLLYFVSAVYKYNPTLILYLITLPFCYGNIWLLDQLFHRLGRRGTEAVLVFYGFICFELHSVTAFFILASLYLILKGGSRVGEVIGVGTAYIFSPVLMFLPYLKKMGRKNWRGVLVQSSVFLFYTVCWFLPFATANFPIFISNFTWQSERIPQMTVWSLFDATGVDRVGATPTAEMMVQPYIPQGSPPINTILSLLFVVAQLSICTLSNVEHDEDIVSYTLLVYLVFLFFSKNITPTYVLWVIPLVLLVFGDEEGVVLSSVLVVSFMYTPYQLYRIRFGDDLIRQSLDLSRWLYGLSLGFNHGVLFSLIVLVVKRLRWEFKYGLE